MNNPIITSDRLIQMLILRCLSKGETIEYDRNFNLYLPNGVEKLNWAKDTTVLIMYRLKYDSFSYIKNIYDTLNPTNMVVIVIKDDEDEHDNIINTDRILGRNIKIIGYTGLLKQIQGLYDSTTKAKRIKVGGSKDIYQQNLLNKLKSDIRNNKISIFMGAGVSTDAGVVGWDGLLEKLYEKRGIDKKILSKGEYDNLTKGRYIMDYYKDYYKDNLDIFQQDMRSILYENVKDSNLIDTIAELINKCNIESVISYNYDDLVEQKIIEKKGKCQSVYDKSRPTDNETLQIYHVHGFVPQKGACSEIVLGEKEYHKVYQEVYNWGNVEQLHTLCRSTCLFIGFSMKDPNLRRLMDISNDGTNVPSVHYIFLRKKKHNTSFMESIMRGFGVSCVWYDKHDDLPDLLNELIS